MLVKMLETRRVSEDGFRVQRLEANETYDLADMAACQVLTNGWGRETSICEDMAELGELLRYQRFLNDRRNPPLSFETWRKEHGQKGGAA
jgi:hypothetical protein